MSKKALRMYKDRVISAEYVGTPFPVRSWDWMATLDDHDYLPNGLYLMGLGSTEESAVDDLIKQARENGL